MKKPIINSSIPLNSYKIMSLAPFVAFLGILFLYWRVLWDPYVLNDDWSFFSYSPEGFFRKHPQAGFYILVGREAYLIIGSIMERFITSVNSLCFLRFLSLCLVFFSAFKLAALIKDKFLSFFLLITLTILPSSLVDVEWVTMFPFVVAMAFSVVSFFWIYNSDYASKKILGVLLLLFSVFCYQPYCFFFIVPALILAMYDPNILLRREFLASLLIFVVCLLFYWFLQSQIFLPYLLKQKNFLDIYNQLGVFKPELSHHPFGRLLDLINLRFSFLFNPFVQFGDFGFSMNWLILAVYAMALLFKTRFFLLRFLIFLLFSLFVLSPYLLSKNGHDGFRVMAVQSTGAMVFFVFMLEALFDSFRTLKVKNVIRTSLGFFLIMFCMNQWSYANSVAKYYSDEYNYLKNMLSFYKGGGVCLVPLSSRQTYGDQKQLGNGEFFHNTFTDLNNTTIAINLFIRGKFPQLQPSAIKQESGLFVYSYPDCSRDALFVINMNNLRISTSEGDFL